MSRMDGSKGKEMAKRVVFSQLTVADLIRKTANGGYDGLQSKDREFFIRREGIFSQIIEISYTLTGVTIEEVTGNAIACEPSENVLSVWSYDDTPPPVPSPVPSSDRTDTDSEPL